MLRTLNRFVNSTMVITEHTPGREYQVSSKGASRERLIALHNRLLSRFTYRTIAVGEWQRELLEGARREPRSVGNHRRVQRPERAEHGRPVRAQGP